MKKENDTYNDTENDEGMFYEMKTDDITDKKVLIYEENATGKIYIDEMIYEAIKNKNGDFKDIFKIAASVGISGAKKTYNLIPSSHMNILTYEHITFELKTEKVMKDLNTSTISNLIEKYVAGGKVDYETKYFIEASCHIKSKSVVGIETEAITCISIALITIYDLCKKVNKNIQISDIGLIKKNANGKNYDSSDELNQLIFI